nr:c1q globular head like domain containing protein [uncultured Mediterranean phage uvMED]
MAYQGNKPAEAFSSFQKQDFSTSATTSYTLDHPVSNQNEIALFINFVRQEPTAAYTASGTTLTLTSATTSSDDMYCIYLGKAVQTVNPPNGSVGTSQLADSVKMTPAFSVYLNADQSIANATVTKITLDTETFDTDNAFASNKFTVPSGAAGKYFFIGTITWVNLTDQDEAQVRIHKNGTFVQGSGYFQGQNGTVTYQATQVLDLSVGDYIELHGYQVSGGNISADGGEAYTNLKGFRLGGV